MRKLFLTLAFLFIVTLAGAQQGRLYVGVSTAENPRWATKGDFDGSIIFCRGHYTSVREEPEGIGWWTDYPGSDNNFMVRLAELTEVRVRFDPDRIPFHVVMKLDDDLLYKCPIIFMSDVGTIGFQEKEVKNLQNYFDKGGFLWVDDFWGPEAWDQWEYEIRRVLPSGLYPMIDVPADHPVFSTLYRINGGIWQQPHAEFWYYGCGSGEDTDMTYACHSTSERGELSKEPHFRAILDDRGRAIVLMTHNTDIGDGWEEEKQQYFEYLNTFSARSYALGINIFLYALTH